MAFHTPTRRGKATRALLALAGAAVCLSACDGGSAKAETSAPIPLQLQMGVALPPGGLATIGLRELVKGLYAETLLLSDRNGSTRPRLCEKWEWLEGGTILKLTLRQGISFHDGSPLDAETAAGLLRQKFAAEIYTFTYRSVTRIEVLDERTLQIRLARPEALLLEDLTDARMMKEDAVGTGPFVIDGPITDEAATLRAFRGYYPEPPQVERLEIKRYASLRGAWSAMMRGEINTLYEVSREAAPFVEAESSVRTYPLLRPYVYSVVFNARHPVLARPAVRQALSYAVDRDAIVRDVMGGRGERADGPVWKYHWAYSTAHRTYDYNPDLARLKLDAAGLPLRQHGDGQMPSRFRFTCLIMGDDSRFERIALVLQKQLYDVGVDMQIEAVPLLQLVDRFTGRFDAIFMEVLSGRSLTWLYRTWRSKPIRHRELNPGYTAGDAALDRLREAFAEADVKRSVGDLQSVFHDDPPAIFVAWAQTSRAISSKIQVPYESNMDVVGRLWRAQWAPAETAEQ